MLYKLVPIKKSNAKVGTVTSTKNTHQIPKNQISVPESLKTAFSNKEYLIF